MGFIACSNVPFKLRSLKAGKLYCKSGLHYNRHNCCETLTKEGFINYTFIAEKESELPQ